MSNVVDSSSHEERCILLTELTNSQKEYIKLLSDELDELVGIASTHGWRSSRVEDGMRLREKIHYLESSLNDEQ